MEQTESTEYALTADEKAMVLPLVESVSQAQLEVQAILRAIIRVRGLQGQWSLDGDRLVKAHANGNGSGT